jgi:predicted ArsR family transcriptional regulator
MMAAEATGGTLRQKILELIKNRPQDASTLARQLNIKPRGVEGHLEHIQNLWKRAEENS